MSRIWKCLDLADEPTMLQPASRNYGMEGKEYPLLKIAICHDNGEFFITVHRKDSMRKSWYRASCDQWPIELIKDVIELVQVAEEFINPSSPYAERPEHLVEDQIKHTAEFMREHCANMIGDNSRGGKEEP